jgi:hypothetical protein
MPGPVDDALAACADLKENYDDALEQLEAARQQLDNARESYDDAGGFFDDSTAWDGSLGAGALTVCVAATAGWCLVGILGAGLGIAASESDRQDEIASAKALLESAELLVNLAESNILNSWNAFWNCFTHELAKGATP